MSLLCINRNFFAISSLICTFIDDHQPKHKLPVARLYLLFSLKHGLLCSRHLILVLDLNFLLLVIDLNFLDPGAFLLLYLISVLAKIAFLGLDGIRLLGFSSVPWKLEIQ